MLRMLSDMDDRASAVVHQLSGEFETSQEVFGEIMEAKVEHLRQAFSREISGVESRLDAMQATARVGNSVESVDEDVEQALPSVEHDEDVKEALLRDDDEAVEEALSCIKGA